MSARVCRGTCSQEANEESRSAEEERNGWVKVTVKVKIGSSYLFFYEILQVYHK